jgi:WhiB family redox-sensing transcriptional regulator
MSIITPIRNPAWMDDAACTNVDPELFFPEGRDQEARIDEAKAVCASCPVLELCLVRALDNKEQHGIWAGATSHDERRRMVRNRKRPSRAKEEETA